jgi:hypothetical protein
MNRRHFISAGLALAILALGGAPSSRADDGAGDSGDSGGDSSSGDNSSSDSSSGGGGDSSSSDSGSSGDGGASSSPSGEGDGQESHAFSGGQEGSGVGADTGKALPLPEMLKIFSSTGSNITLIDVILIGRGSKMKYRFKYIDVGGSVRKSYFNALTGAPIP